MKIFDGCEEFEIVPWHECEDCTKHLHFSGHLSALILLQRLRTSELVMDSLRRLLRVEGNGGTLDFHRDAKVLEQVAQMLAMGELHLTQLPLVVGTKTVRTFKDAPSRPQPFELEPTRRPTAEPPLPPPPEEPMFVPNVDPVAIAQVLTHAALSGVPFCAE